MLLGGTPGLSPPQAQAPRGQVSGRLASLSPCHPGQKQHAPTQTCLTHCRPPGPQPPISGRRLTFPICSMLSFGRELLPSVLWTVKQVFINKLR